MGYRSPGGNNLFGKFNKKEAKNDAKEADIYYSPDPHCLKKPLVWTLVPPDPDNREGKNYFHLGRRKPKFYSKAIAAAPMANGPGKRKTGPQDFMYWSLAVPMLLERK